MSRRDENTPLTSEETGEGRYARSHSRHGLCAGVNKRTRNILITVLIAAIVVVIAAIACVVYVAAPKSYVKSIKGENMKGLMEDIILPLGSRTVGENYTVAMDIFEKKVRDKLANFADLVTIKQQCFDLETFVIEKDPSVGFKLSADSELIKMITNTDYKVERYGSNSQIYDVPVVVIENSCSKDSYANVAAGAAILVRESDECTYMEKLELAAGAGAAAFIISAPEGTPMTAHTIYTAYPIPRLGFTYAVGEMVRDLVAKNQGFSLTIETYTVTIPANACNLIVETLTGDPNNLIVSGAHFDTVSGTTGVDDNGSGVVANLELLYRYFKTGLYKKAVNRVIFAFWAAEEIHILGSQAWLVSLGDDIRKVLYNINMDMMGAVNYVNEITDYNTAIDALKPGCKILDEAFVEYFEENNMYFNRIPLRADSDHYRFIETAIPAIFPCTAGYYEKTYEEWLHLGGIVNALSDPCYHLPCDYVNNVDYNVMEIEIRPVAHAIEKLAKYKDLRIATYPPEVQDEIEAIQKAFIDANKDQNKPAFQYLNQGTVSRR